jgi:NADH-quinone oxidoreductase subunit N
VPSAGSRFVVGGVPPSNGAADPNIPDVRSRTGSAENCRPSRAAIPRTHPWWTAALVFAFPSLLGLPPLAGFVGKLELFTAAVDADPAWLAVVAVVNTVISLYYYLRVIARTILESSPQIASPSLRAGHPLGAALAVTAAEPLIRLAERATMLGA